MQTHTLQEINELKEWFQQQKLPATLYIDKATFARDLADTVDMLFEQAYVCYENPKMQGCILLLMRIKHLLEHPEEEYKPKAAKEGE